MNSATPKRFDVLGLGCAAVDDLLYVPKFPAADQKVRVSRRARRCGGLTAVALVAAARLGARCAYAGCLGTDDYSEFVAGHFAREGVDISLAPRLSEAHVIHSTIVVGEDTGSRAILFEDAGMIGAHPALPPAEAIRAAAVLFVDHFGVPGSIRASRLARAAGIPVVGDFERESDARFGELLNLADHLILSEEFARWWTRTATPAAAAAALWRTDRAIVIVTAGANGCWSVSAEDGLTPRHHPAFPVKATDTTGCGDVFHGAYAAGLARGETLEDRIQMAAAAAALKARDGEIPHRAEVDNFLQANRPSARSPH